MKKTVTLTSLIKAKNDLELYIKIDQMKRLKKLFDPTFDIDDLNSKIETKEDQLIQIKIAIANANAVTLDDDGQPINNSIYLLSKYNRFKADLLSLQRRLDTDEFINNNESAKTNLLADIQELDELMKTDTDKKLKAEHLSSKNKLKKSLSKISLTTKSHTTDLSVKIKKDIEDVEVKIVQIKSLLSKLNDNTKISVDIADEFELVVK